MRPQPQGQAPQAGTKRTAEKVELARVQRSYFLDLSPGTAPAASRGSGHTDACRGEEEQGTVVERPCQRTRVEGPSLSQYPVPELWEARGQHHSGHW